MQQLKVLIVTYRPELRSKLEHLLEQKVVEFPFTDKKFSYDTMFVKSTCEIKNILRHDHIDIAIIAHNPPDLDGFGIIEDIHLHSHNTHIIAVSTAPSLDFAIEASSKGAFDILSVPFSEEDFDKALENVTKHNFLVDMTKDMLHVGKRIRFEFLSLLSHELKAPIISILGYLQMIEDRTLGDNIKSYDQIIDRTIHRVKGMRHLIMDMLDMTKLESGTTSIDKQEVDVLDTAKCSIDTLKPFAIQRDIEIDLHEPEANVSFCADPREIEIIFNNLISNAIKYNVEKGKVDVRIEKMDKCVSISVKDSGYGISEEDQQKIFHEFYRTKSPLSKKVNGSGLGLSILKKITDLYGGEVKVESEIGKGSTFTVTLCDNEQHD